MQTNQMMPPVILTSMLVSCGGHLADTQGPGEPPPMSSLAMDLGLDPPTTDAHVDDPMCESGGDLLEDLRVEVHDGDWGYASVMVMATVDAPVVSLDAELTTVSDGKQTVREADVSPGAATGCGEMAITGWDLSHVFSITEAHVTITDVTFADGTVLPGPYELDLDLPWIQP